MSANGNLIECDGLTKKYGSTLAVNNLTLELQAGSPIALIGPNGAGKTTLLSLLCGFIRPSSGSVRVFGAVPGTTALHGKLSALPQDALLDPRFSIIRQLQLLGRLQGLSATEARTESERTLDLVQLRDSSNQNPQELSHGMRKRVAIAQMLMGKPELALLDEPTAGLDPPNVKIIRDVINSNATNTTFVISSHNLDELEKLCTTIVYLSEGKLLKNESIAALDDEEDYLTVRVTDVPAPGFIEACKNLDGVLDVVQQQQGAFLVSYDATRNPALDISLMQLMNQQGWTYKSVIKGRSLEDKLFQ